jgi:hypothetical protein
MFLVDFFLFLQKNKIYTTEQQPFVVSSWAKIIDIYFYTPTYPNIK